MRLRAAIRGNLRQLLARERRVTEAGVTRGVHQVAARLQRSLRRQVRRAGLGEGLEKAWRLAKYPRRGRSLRAAALVFSRATRLHRAHDKSETITTDRGDFLVLPTDRAIADGLAYSHSFSRGSLERRYSDIDKARDRLGHLQYIPVDGGRRGLLGTEEAGQFVVYFVLVPSVRSKKRLRIKQAQENAQNQLAGSIVRQIAAADRRIR